MKPCDGGVHGACGSDWAAVCGPNVWWCVTCAAAAELPALLIPLVIRVLLLQMRRSLAYDVVLWQSAAGSSVVFATPSPPIVVKTFNELKSAINQNISTFSLIDIVQNLIFSETLVAPNLGYELTLFSSNNAVLSGGGKVGILSLQRSTFMTHLVGLTFKDGYGYCGGSIHSEMSALNASNCVFVNNVSTSDNWGGGGALGFHDVEQHGFSYLTNCLFVNNIS